MSYKAEQAEECVKNFWKFCNKNATEIYDPTESLAKDFKLRCYTHLGTQTYDELYF